MARHFRSPGMPAAQMFLMPPCLDDFVPQDATVRVLAEIVASMDLRVLEMSAPQRGAPAYSPRLLFGVLVFAYSEGLRSSRRIETATRYDMRYMWLSEMTPLDHVTLCRFRRKNEAVFLQLFKETVKLCQSLGLVLLKEAAVDGTKLEANVSGKHTYGEKRLAEEEARLDGVIQKLLLEAEQTDAQEERSGGGGGSAEVPEDLRDAKRRRERLREVRKQMQESGRKTVAATDPESRVMPVHGRKRAAYNAQAVVDGGFQVITAADVVSEETDNHELAPMMKQAIANTDAVPQQTLADSGYWSQESLSWAEQNVPDAYIQEAKKKVDAHADYCYDSERDIFVGADGRELRYWATRQKDGRHYRVYRTRGKPKKELWVRLDAELTLAMREKLATEDGRRIYGRRRAIVEPVFGHMKVAYGLRRLLLRGLSGARIEFLLACIAHNLGKVRVYAPCLQQ